MIRAFLAYFLENGTYNFDLVISKCLSIVLISSLGARSGDIGRSEGYTDKEFMAYKDIQLYFPVDAGPESKFSDLRAIFTIRYAKGKKQSLQDDVVKYLRPLDDVQYVHMCPIALLLTHALRNGLVHGTTLEEVLDNAMKQPDRRVMWKFPDRPVLVSFEWHDGPRRCALDHPVTNRQVHTTIKQMGVISGILTRIHPHSLRLGTIRDVAHIKKNPDNTFASLDEIRRYAGHSDTSMRNGITEWYAGDMA